MACGYKYSKTKVNKKRKPKARKVGKKSGKK